MSTWIEVEVWLSGDDYEPRLVRIDGMATIGEVPGGMGKQGPWSGGESRQGWLDAHVYIEMSGGPSFIAMGPLDVFRQAILRAPS